jgi:Spy/CpxP family protein refolding chaperone
MLSSWIKRSAKRRYLILAALGILGFAGAGAAWASHHMMPACHRFGPGAMRLQVEFVLDRALKQVDATPEQKEQVEAIFARAFDAHKALRADCEQMRAEAIAILKADKIDRTGLEALRVKHVQKIQQGSQLLTQAVGDAADVLTPDQRQKLAEWADALHDS